MKSLIIPISLIFLKTYLCQDITELFEKINEDTIKYNEIGAEIAWESSVNPGNPELPGKAAAYQKNRIIWQQEICDKLTTLQYKQLLNNTQRRQTYLLCRGPKFTYNEARITSAFYEELQSIYSEAEVCIPTKTIILNNNLADMEGAILNYLSTINHFLNLEQNTSTSVSFAARIAVKEIIKKKNYFCLKGESDFEKLMTFSRNENVLRWLWLVWREKVGPPMREPYKKLVNYENRAAKRNGYTDIGDSWRDELEIPHLRKFCHNLYASVRPLYTLLHGVVRFFLRRHYGEVVPETGPIPAHLLGNLWAQNWEPIADLILPKTVDLENSIEKLNWTVLHMVKRAEDFYQSLGLPAMTDTFWRESIFARENNDKARCHGTAADMFKNGDYRLLYCSGKSMEDFYVLHHEIGHIQYYMAYENQPGIFRQGANTAFHESIGDAIMYGVMTPLHLYRLRLVNDTILYTNGIENEGGLHLNKTFESDEGITKTEEEETLDATTDDILMLKEALNKLPQIPFSLLIDEYRWKYFEGGLDENYLNREFWAMALKMQGIAPPGYRSEEYFDIGAKFHVPDNTPYIRYFLSSFLQHQLFESLCKTAVFGRRDVNEPIPDTITMNRCDIYGSKAAGKLLKDLMSRGSSQHWREILFATTGKDDITAAALKRYYQPLNKLLMRFVQANRIPIGW